MDKKISTGFKYEGYDWQLDLRNSVGGFELGLTSGSTFYRDPKRLLFLLSRYKFVSKMIEAEASVLEIGCGDGFGSRIIRQICSRYTGIDIEPIFIEEAKVRYKQDGGSRFIQHDILKSTFVEKFGFIFSLDVLEHLPIECDDLFFKNACDALENEGVMIVGMPSLESQPYASDNGIGHINCKTGPDLKTAAQKHFKNVFLFEMNDEIIHTWFSKLAHYHLILCCGKR
jgi:2-polyprenyl-3-methyl-5-hydroxy-6-metoxy-1,4-benzoquinol methylase